MAADGAPLRTDLRNDTRKGASWWDWYCEPPPDRTPYEVVRDGHGGWRDGYPVRRVMEIRITGEQEPGPPRRYSFTRDRLIEALTHLEAYPATAGPGQRVFINAESMADAIIRALGD